MSSEEGRRPRVLFVCVENSCRSQMAEGFARRLGGGRVEAHSAGSRPSGAVNPRALEVMAELEIDLGAHVSTAIEDVPAGPWDAVVTMGCGDACPWVPAARREDWAIPDPKGLPPADFRRIRDDLGRRVHDLLHELGVEPEPPPVTDAGRSVLVLAGGRSRRLGVDKPFVEIAGRTLLERVLDATATIDDVVIAVRDPAPFQTLLLAAGWRPEATGSSGRGRAMPVGNGSVAAPGRSVPSLIRGTRRARLLPDPVPDAGPLGALAGGLAAVREPFVIVLSADLPFVNAALVTRLVTALRDAPELDACVPVIAGQPQWLCAAYRRRLAPHARRRAEEPGADPSVRGLLEGREWRALDESDLAALGDAAALTRDIDTPADLAWARARALEQEGEGNLR